MSMRGERLRVFTGTAHPRLAQDICAHMGVPLGAASLGAVPRR
jgi:phosphoribosylpyrophosphate synthetase